MMSKKDQCCLCKILDPSPEEGQPCGLLSSMWDHIHPEEEDWFDETFSMFEVVSSRSLGILNPRLALQASNVAFGSVINLNFHFLYLHYGNK